MLSLLAALFFCFVLACSLYLRYGYKGRMIAKLPGPKGWPLIGNMFTIMKSQEALFEFPRSLHREYGNICKLEGCGVRSVEIFNADDVETLLSTTRFNEKREPYHFLRPWLCEGLLLSNGNKWHQRRKLLTPVFHFNILKKYTETFNEETAELLALIHEETEKQQTNLLPLITSMTLNIMCETSMGTSLRETEDTVTRKYFNALHTLGSIVAHRLTRIWLHEDFIYNFSKFCAKANLAVKDLHTFTKNIIQERKTYLQNKNISELCQTNEVYGKKGRLAMLDLLIQNEREEKIDSKGITEEVDTFMFEGHDTTAMALTFMIMRIANETQVQKLIHQEMLKIFGDSRRPPTMKDLNDMKYLDCCIKESLRIYPSVPFVARFAAEDVILSGYRVPIGTQCHIHIYDIHHRSDYFPDPEKFLPERFLPENTIRRHPYSYIPFSAGPRNCIGQKFAMLELKTVISGIIRRFHIESVTKTKDVKFKADIVLRTVHPIFVRFRFRK